MCIKQNRRIKFSNSKLYNIHASFLLSVLSTVTKNKMKRKKEKDSQYDETYNMCDDKTIFHTHPHIN